MTPPVRNSMAAVLTVAMTAVIWIAIALGVFVLGVLTLGLVSTLSGGSFEGLTIEMNEDVGAGTFVLAMAATAAIMGVIVYICVQLRRILSTLANGDPFVPDNAPRLTRIAFALGGMELASMGLSATGLLSAATDDGWALSINLSLWAAVAALLVLSQVFREGTRLREEEKMTI